MNKKFEQHIAIVANSYQTAKQYETSEYYELWNQLGDDEKAELGEYIYNLHYIFNEINMGSTFDVLKEHLKDSKIHIELIDFLTTNGFHMRSPDPNDDTEEFLDYISKYNEQYKFLRN